MNKSMVVAMWDIRNALTVKFVKYGIVLAAVFGPALVILTVVGMALVTTPTVFNEVIQLILPYMSSMLAIFAVIPTTMLAANALVGEREQNTLEPLLCTPLTDRELLWGKVLGSALPSLIILVSSVVIAEVVTNLFLAILGYPLILVPDLPGLFLLSTAVPLTIFAIVAVMILISGRVTRVYEAYQTTGAVVMTFIIPMILPLAGMDDSGIVDVGMIWFANVLTLVIAIILFAISWTLAITRFNRDRLISLV